MMVLESARNDDICESGNVLSLERSAVSDVQIEAEKRSWVVQTNHKIRRPHLSTQAGKERCMTPVKHQEQCEGTVVADDAILVSAKLVLMRRFKAGGSDPVVTCFP